MSEIQPIKIAITALGGQGGGVLSNWIVALGEANGFIAQSTSVPGVAQRTGATIYYVELFPKGLADAKGKSPILALMPVPGDVDVVIASEFMEAGRALLRGLVTSKTILIVSSHRDYAIVEKIDMGDGRQETDAVRRVAEKSARNLVEADMAKAATLAGSPISAVLFGALCGAGALPFASETFEQTIKDTGRAVESNLRGFAAGVEIGKNNKTDKKLAVGGSKATSKPISVVGGLFRRISQDFPEVAHTILNEGVKRTADFQDGKYGALYLDRVLEVYLLDQQKNGAAQGWRLTLAAAKHIALWMAYDDAIRVADLKTRRTRFARFRQDVHAEPDQIVIVSEYLHPRLEEICDLLPSLLARPILASKSLSRILGGIVGKGRRIPTTKLRGFLPLYLMASFKFSRRRSYRFRLEQSRIEDWLGQVIRIAETDYHLACEVTELQRLIKGYGETHERGLGNFQLIMAVIDHVQSRSDAATLVAKLRDEALKDEDGVALKSAIQKIDKTASAA